MARVEDGRQAHARLKRLDNQVVEVVIDDVALALVVDRVDDLVVAVVLVAVQVLGLTAVAWEIICQLEGGGNSRSGRAYQSSGGTGSRWAGRS